MEYFGAKHKFLLGGICFDKGNLTNGTFMQTYTTGYTGGVIAANNVMGATWTITFASVGLANFGTIPVVTATSISNVLNSFGVHIQVGAVSTTAVAFTAYNARSTIAAANTWGISFIAVGGY